MGDRVKKRVYMLPQADERFADDQYGTTVEGAYDKDGYFLVLVEMRQRGRTDKAGYLVNQKGNRTVDH